MSRPVIVLPRADRDLREQWVWLAPRNFYAAEDFLKRATEIFEVISRMPECGKLRPELGQDLRSFPCDKHVIFYRVTHNHIDIVRVLAAARDLKPSLFE